MLGALRNRGHHLHRLARILTHRGLLREHHGVGAVEDRVGHVGDLGPRRARRDDHRVEHLGGRDRRARHPPGELEQLLLHDRHALDRQLDAQVAPRDHHAVGHFEDLRRALHGQRLLDLGDQR